MAKRPQERERARDEQPGTVGTFSDIGTFRWDVATGSVTWSPEMYRLHGIGASEFGGTPEAYLTFVHPDDVAVVEEIVGHLLAGGESRPLEYRVQRPDGEIRHLLGTNEVVRDEDGHPLRIIGTVRDVSELRQGAPAGAAREETEAALQRSQERFRALVENSFDVITVFDSDGTVLYSSPSCRRVLGYEAEELIGRRGDELVHPDDRDEANRAFAAAAAEPGSVTQVVHRILHKDGTYRTVEIVGTNLFAHPAVRGMVSNLRDVTERHTLEEALRQAQKMEAVGRLAGGVAHDFNNLLTVILGEVDIALAGAVASPDLATSLDRVRAAGQRAASLTRQLLAFSRRELVTFDILDLNRLVGQASNMLRRLIEEDVALELDLDPGLWRLRGDPSQLEQLLVNLMLNGRDSMPEGGTLRISTANVTVGRAPPRPELAAGEYVRLEISDTGTGMPEEVRRHAFEPFFTTKAEAGTGLGLATCYSVVKQHGGHIEAASVEGQGTVITAYLPRALGAVAMEPSGGVPAAGLGSETILLVEDEEAVRRVTARMLEDRGYAVLTAADSEAAMSLVSERNGAIDLLVTDVVLTGMGGRELAEKITAEYPGIRVMYVSGYTDDSFLRRGLERRDLTLVRKPFSAEELAARVRAVLDGG